MIDMRKPRRIYTLITPEGLEKIIGAYTSPGMAAGICKRQHPADWLALCSYPCVQREPRVGEKIKFGKNWEG